MGKTTEISWTDHTFNPWWGCFKVSAGCTHCYADTLATRWGHKIWGPAATTRRRLFGERHWTEPYAWDAAAQAQGRRRRVFCASMADVFEDHPQVGGERQKLWSIIRGTPSLDWLLLTKRPENVPTMMPDHYWPNVWLGTSTEDQEQANKRIPLLLKLRERAPILFLSIEPQIGPITFRWAQWQPFSRTRSTNELDGLRQIDWVITGGESGPGHRPFDLDWARLTRDECAAAGVAWHYKQFGGLHHAAGGCLLDGREYKEFPSPLVPA